MTGRVRHIVALGISICCAILSFHAFAQTDPRGKTCKAGYIGDLNLKDNDDGRSFTLISPYGYADGNCEAWMVPAKAVVDGASIPQIFWSFLGGPYEGKYRNASVIHDWLCSRRNEPWEKVHRIFYEAMLTSKVEPSKAKLMYLAVYYEGPRWDTQTVINMKLVKMPLASTGIDPQMVKRYKEVHYAKDSKVSAGVRYIADLIRRDDIDLSQIEKLAEQARAFDGKSDEKAPPLPP